MRSSAPLSQIGSRISRRCNSTTAFSPLRQRLSSRWCGRPVGVALHGLLAVGLLQVALGIATLVLVVPVPLAAAHQAGAVLLLTAAINFRHTMCKVAAMDENARAPI